MSEFTECLKESLAVAYEQFGTSATFGSTAYLVETNDQYRKIPAELVVHLMELERPDQIRGASALARALNQPALS